MNRTSVAFAPAHITGFFKIYPDGSTGAGLNTNLGANTRASFSSNFEGKEHQIFINEEPSKAPVSNRVIEKFSSYYENGILEIHHKLDYPVGYGMGMSGAGAFSLSLALNEVLEAGLSYDDCMQVAVEAEIESGTGLGDVIAQKFHGVMIGLPPYPSRIAEVIPCEKKIVGCGFFEPLDTGSIIRDDKWKERINEVGEECMQELSKDKTIEKFIALSRHFTFETKLCSSTVKQVMKDLPQSSMAMLGQTVFLLAESEKEAKETLSHHCKNISISSLAEKGAHLKPYQSGAELND